MSNNLFDFKIYKDGMESLLDDLRKRDIKTHIISGNAEVLKYPLMNEELFLKFNESSSIIIPDGISVYIPYKCRINSSIKRITGIDLMEEILNDSVLNGNSVYFLGATLEVLNSMVETLKIKYPSLKIAGHHHGYIDIKSCNDILEDIKKSNADILFVAMGTPMQESFIFEYMNELPCNLFMGVGGSFDVLSGMKSRSPEWVSKIGFEWLYRIFQDKSKLKRVKNNLIFTLKNLFFVNRRK